MVPLGDSHKHAEREIFDYFTKRGGGKVLRDVFYLKKESLGQCKQLSVEFSPLLGGENQAFSYKTWAFIHERLIEDGTIICTSLSAKLGGVMESNEYEWGPANGFGGGKSMRSRSSSKCCFNNHHQSINVTEVSCNSF